MDPKTNDFSQSKNQNQNQTKIGNGGHRNNPDLSEDLRDVKESLSRTASHAKDKAEDLFQDVKDGTVNLQETIVSYVKENPAKALGFALLSGFLAAILMRK